MSLTVTASTSKSAFPLRRRLPRALGEILDCVTHHRRLLESPTSRTDALHGKVSACSYLLLLTIDEICLKLGWSLLLINSNIADSVLVRNAPATGKRKILRQSKYAHLQLFAAGPHRKMPALSARCKPTDLSTGFCEEMASTHKCTLYPISIRSRVV